GTIARSSTANYYGFDTGSINPITDSFTVSGVVRTMQRGGSSGFNLGFFGQGTGADPVGSFGSSGNSSNFIGLNFDDGINVQAIAFDVFGGRDRSGTFASLHDPAGDVPGPTVPFTMTWQPPPAGAGHEKGELDINFGGTLLNWVYTGDDNFVEFTRFGILGVSASGGSCQTFLDD